MGKESELSSWKARFFILKIIRVPEIKWNLNEFRFQLIWLYL